MTDTSATKASRLRHLLSSQRTANGVGITLFALLLTLGSSACASSTEDSTNEDSVAEDSTDQAIRVCVSTNKLPEQDCRTIVESAPAGCDSPGYWMTAAARYGAGIESLREAIETSKDAFCGTASVTETSLSDDELAGLVENRAREGDIRGIRYPVRRASIQSGGQTVALILEIESLFELLMAADPEDLGAVALYGPVELLAQAVHPHWDQILERVDRVLVVQPNFDGYGTSIVDMDSHAFGLLVDGSLTVDSLLDLPSTLITVG